MLRKRGWYQARLEMGCSTIHAAPTACKAMRSKVTLRQATGVRLSSAGFGDGFEGHLPKCRKPHQKT